MVDWSPLDRSKLEAAVRHGLVPVRIDGCRARIVDGCTVRRPYTFAATARQRELVVLGDREEIAARVPLLATRLGASVMQGATLGIAMTVVGRYESDGAPVAASELEGTCDRATHVVASLSVGAFVIGGESTTAAEASADVAHASYARERKHLDAAGSEAACAATRRADAAPPDECSVPLRVELRALRPSPEVDPRPPPTPEAVSAAESMRRALESAKKELGWCHRVARRATPDLSGVLTVSVRLARRGNVRSVAAKAEGNLDDAIAACATARVGQVMFPAADDDRPRTIVIPVLFGALAR